MQNKTYTFPAIVKIMAVSAVYLSLVPNALSQPVAVPIPLGAPAIATALTTPDAPKLVYKAAGGVLTVEELAAAQRKKMEEEFFKKAGYTSTPPAVVVKAKTGDQSKAASASKPKNSISLVGVYGTENAQKAEILYNGQLMVVVPGGRIGTVSIDSIQAGRVAISYSGESKQISVKQRTKNKVSSVGESVRQTLKPGDVLEITG
jgi:hypothetical protein